MKYQDSDKLADAVGRGILYICIVIVGIMFILLGVV